MYTNEYITPDMFPKDNEVYTNIAVKEIRKRGDETLISYLHELDDGIVTIIYSGDDVEEDEIRMHYNCTVDFNPDTGEITWAKECVPVYRDPNNEEGCD